MKVKFDLFFTLLLYTGLIGLPTFSETVYTPALPLLTQVFGVSDSEIKYSVIIYIAFFAFSQLFYGNFLRYISIRKLLLLGIGIYIAGSLLILCSEHFAELMLGRSLQGIGGAAGSTLVRVIMKEHYSLKEQRKYFPIILGMVAFLPILGPFFGSLIIHFLNWHYIFLLLLVIAFCLIVVTASQLELSKSIRTQSVYFKWQYFFPDKLFMSYVFSGSLLLSIILVYSVEAPFFIIKVLHYSPLIFGYISLSVALCYFLGTLFSSRILSEYPLNNTIRLGVIVVSVGSIALFCLGLLYGLSLSTLILPIVVVMFGAGVAKSNISIVAMHVLSEHSGQASSLIGFWQMFISGGVVWLGVHEIGTRLNMFAVICVMISMLLCYLTFSTSYSQD